MNKLNVFVTGENGQIGSRLCEIISKNEKFNLLNSNYGIFENENEININDYDNLSKQFVSRGVFIDLIIHTAAIVGTDFCDNNQDLAVNTNVYGTFNLLKLARNHGSKFVYFSTTAIYDPEKYDGGVILEDSEKNPLTLYGATKYSGEILSKSLIDPKKLLVVRPCFAFGGFNDTHSAIARLIINALENKLNSTDKKEVVLLNPHLLKDYMHLHDLCDGVISLIENNLSGDFNISLGEPVKFGKVVAEILSNGLVPVFELDHEKDYLKNHVVSNEKIKKATGWSPKYSLESGIKKSIKDIYEGISLENNKTVIGY